MTSGQPNVSVLCVGRHSYLSDHFARYFGDLGFSTRAVVGLECAVFAARESLPDVVLCDYELLATSSLECWEQDELLSRTAVIAVSLARRPNETDLLDINGIAGFLYLPTLDLGSARQTLLAAGAASRARYRLAPPTTSLSATSMSATSLSATSLSATSLSATSLSATSLSATSLSATSMCGHAET